MSLEQLWWGKRNIYPLFEEKKEPMDIRTLREKLRKQKEQLTLVEQQKIFLMGTIAILEDLLGRSSRRDKRDPKAKTEEEGPQPGINNSARA